MNIFLNEYFGFCFELNFELNHFSARFNEKMNFQNVSYRATPPRKFLLWGPREGQVGTFKLFDDLREYSPRTLKV